MFSVFMLQIVNTCDKITLKDNYYLESKKIITQGTNWYLEQGVVYYERNE